MSTSLRPGPRPPSPNPRAASRVWLRLAALWGGLQPAPGFSPVIGLAALLCTLTLAGCRQDMHDQPRYEPLEASAFFEDGRSARQPVAGTVARGSLRLDAALYAGKSGKAFVTTIPVPVTRGLVDRGRERFNIFCTPCHDRTGSGRGVVVQRGFRAPPSYHIDRLRQAPAGHLFDVITNGYGAMYDFADRIPVADRWAIVAYIRALQLSQTATLSDVPAAEREKLQ